MITVTAFKWVPPFAQGQVRDLRVRWALEEAGIQYDARLVDADELKAESYLAMQPFGQVPVMIEDGEAEFETGAILLDIAERGEVLMSRDPQQRRRTISWLFAALNLIEPFMMNLAEVDFFIKDETLKALRRPAVVAALEDRLDKLAHAIGDRPWLADRFSIADIMMATILRIARHTDLIDRRPVLAGYLARCIARPAFERALEAQMSAFRANAPADDPASAAAS